MGEIERRRIELVLASEFEWIEKNELNENLEASFGIFEGIKIASLKKTLTFQLLHEKRATLYFLVHLKIYCFEVKCYQTENYKIAVQQKKVEKKQQEGK